MEQRIATTGLPGGGRVAYALVGHGPLLVYAPGWLTHLEMGWALPPERGFYEALARGRTLVRYDQPGCGLSGPTARPSSIELELETLAAVIEAVGAVRFDMLGASLGAAVTSPSASYSRSEISAASWARPTRSTPPECPPSSRGAG